MIFRIRVSGKLLYEKRKSVISLHVKKRAPASYI